MSEPPWGHKPPPVDDVTAYWIEAPPGMSPRCDYWLRRHHAGNWRPNRWIRREGYHAAAEQLGVWIWEYLHIIQPLFDEERNPQPQLDSSPAPKS